MNSWQSRIQEYNSENNIVTLPYQEGGDVQTSNNINIPPLDHPYFNSITLNGIQYSLKDRHTVQMIKKIINYYNEKYK